MKTKRPAGALHLGEEEMVVVQLESDSARARK